MNKDLGRNSRQSTHKVNLEKRTIRRRGEREMAQGLRAFLGDLGLVYSTNISQLVSTCNSRLKGQKALLWPSQVLTHMRYLLSQIHTQINKNNKK